MKIFLRGTFMPIKPFLRTSALVLLMLVAVLTIARRQTPRPTIAFESWGVGGLSIWVMTDEGGDMRQLTPPGDCATLPEWSPDGQWISFTQECVIPYQIQRIQPDYSMTTTLLAQTDFAYGRAWSPDGRYILMEGPPADAILLDINSGEHRVLNSEALFPQWSPDGQWIYAYPPDTSPRELIRINVETGNTESIISQDKVDISLSWSPDGSQIAVALQGPERHGLYVMNSDGGNLRPIVEVSPEMYVRDPRWSPDGQWIAFIIYEGNWIFPIYRVRPNGDDLQRLSDELTPGSALQWSPNSQWLLYDGQIDEHQIHIYRLRADGSELQDLTPEQTDNSRPTYSPIVKMNWHPLWGIIAAAGLMFLSITGNLRR